MKSIIDLNTSYRHSIVSDEIIEFHAGRIVVLIGICGVKNRASGEISLKGLTKFAKLDFFIRYPHHFRTASLHLGFEVDSNYTVTESKMIRFHYGPWDDRYNQVLPYLMSRGLLRMTKEGKGYILTLPEKGVELFKNLSKLDEFSIIIQKTKAVKKVMGSKTGSFLKNMIYELFVDEVSNKNLKEIIS